MPIEIRELVIRAVVANEPAGATGDDEDGAGVMRSTGAANTEEIVQECVRQVLRVLRKDHER